MPDYLPANNILGRVDFKKGQRTIRPLPPPGNRLDGREGEALTALFPASQQVTVITLGGSAVTGDINTLVITPTRLADGSPWGSEIGAFTLVFTTAGTQTLTAVGEGLEAKAAADVAITSLTDFTDYQRIRDFCSVTAAAGVITITTRDAGARFSYTFTCDTGNTTETSTSTGTTDDELRAGTVCVTTGHTASYVPKIAAPVAASAATAIFGVVKEQNACKPTTGGYSFKVIPAGNQVAVETWGPMTVYCEGAATVDGSVYVRKTATGTEIAGAVAGSATTDTVQIHTITPTAANTTLYRATITVKNFFTGAVAYTGIIEFTSDADGTATEICNGLRTSLVDDNDELDGIVVGTGTATLILTVAAGYYIDFVSTGPGVLAEAATQAAASDHLLWAGAKFLETTTAAGIQAILVPHP